MGLAVAWLFGVLAATPVPQDEPSALTRDPKGWVDILPGPKLKGWSRVAPISSRGVKSLVNPDLAVWIPDRKTGVLECRGHLPLEAPPGGKPGSHEMLRHEQDLGDFIFHVEWRFTDPARTGWNAGVYARVNEAADIWHQAQVGGGPTTYWFADTPDTSGKIGRIKDDSVEKRVKPPGQWNVYEITGRGDTLTLWANGAVVSQLKGLRVQRGRVGLEAELHHIEFRNLKLKRLDHMQQESK
jgi:Domain of Unknown Function (DUF1080)